MIVFLQHYGILGGHTHVGHAGMGYMSMGMCSNKHKGYRLTFGTSERGFLMVKSVAKVP